MSILNTISNSNQFTEQKFTTLSGQDLLVDPNTKMMVASNEL